MQAGGVYNDMFGRSAGMSSSLVAKVQLMYMAEEIPANLLCAFLRLSVKLLRADLQACQAA
jgi:hypothetical protein